jgi:hypothetical protein
MALSWSDLSHSIWPAVHFTTGLPDRARLRVEDGSGVTHDFVGAVPGGSPVTPGTTPLPAPTVAVPPNAAPPLHGASLWPHAVEGITHLPYSTLEQQLPNSPFLYQNVRIGPPGPGAVPLGASVNGVMTGIYRGFAGASSSGTDSWVTARTSAYLDQLLRSNQASVLRPEPKPPSHLFVR